MNLQNNLKLNLKFSALFLLLILLAIGGQRNSVFAAELAPNLKVLICTGDFGQHAQKRVPMIQDAVAKVAPNANVSWEAHQSYNFTKVLEAPGFASRFDAIVMGDIAIGQLTPRAQENLVSFVQNGGGLIYVMWAKSTLPFNGAEAAVPMPLKNILPVAYPDFSQPHADASTLSSTDAFFQGIDFSALKDDSAINELPHLLRERASSKGRVLALSGAFGPSWRYMAYATFEKIPGGWDEFPGLGEVWTRVLQRASQSSPIRNQSRANLDAKIQNTPLQVSINVDATKTIDEIRAANFSIVALQQLYNEDGGAGEDLFLALNPRDWFDRRTQEVLANTKGVKADKPAFFKDFNIKGIYMADNSYGSYGQWDDKKFAEQTALAIAEQKNNPQILQFFQAGNEPPLNENYVKFHEKFVSDVLKGAPGYKVIGPNKAFNLLGVDPKEMQFYIDRAGKTTDILNWHTYTQPPTTVLAEARYWSDKATGKMRTPGPAKVMFTESDSWNTGDSQFNYLMERAFTFLPEKRIIANFQYCMRPRFEGGTYWFGVLQPEGEFSANYNGYWAWRNLRGQMTPTALTATEGKENLRAISSKSRDGKTLTTVVYYGAPFQSSTRRAETAAVALAVKLPPGNWKLNRSEIAWNVRTETAGKAVKGIAKINLQLQPYHATALTWTKQP